MNSAEILQLALSGAGVAIGGGIWFKMGALMKGQEDLARRVTNLENHVFLGGYKAQ